jgi:Family of unknown function (DUF6058)
LGRNARLTQPRFTAADVEYVREWFVPLDELCRARGEDPSVVRSQISAGKLLRPSYVLPDGVEMVPDTYFRLADEGSGVDRLPEHFSSRYRAAATRDGVTDDADDEWQAYLSGEYGVCLREVTPETIVRKPALTKQIEALLDDPRPETSAWRAELRQSVDELDRLERPFAPQYDRVRFGVPSSRERLISAVRERYSTVFGAAARA